MQTSTQNLFYLFFIVVLFFLSFSVVSINAGINIRVGQLSVLLFFAVAILYDLRNKQLNETLLIFFIFFAILLTFLSKNSSYSKIGEIKFIIKYMLLFPATFYIGQWVVKNYKIQTLVKAFEVTLVLYIFMAFLLFFLPIPGLFNDRGVLNGFQGTFFEAGWFALVVGAFTLTSILIRLDYNLKFDRYQYTLYFFSLVSLVLSKNKTIWIGIIIISTFIILFKTILSHRKNIQDSVKNLRYINSFYFLGIFSIFIVIFFVVNLIIPEPIVSVAMLEEKLNDERGKAYLAAIELLKRSDWFGGYGFGFIQQYFSVYTDEIIGLDSNSGMIFNSYLDIWISAGIVGVIYHFLLLKLSLSGSHLLTLVIPIYWFISANTNPTIGDEYYYLFLGISYGFIQKHKKELVR